MKTLKLNPVEIGREEAFELCGYGLPNKRQEIIISRSTLETSQVVYKEGKSYFIAELKVLDNRSCYCQEIKKIYPNATCDFCTGLRTIGEK